MLRSRVLLLIAALVALGAVVGAVALAQQGRQGPAAAQPERQEPPATIADFPIPVFERVNVTRQQLRQIENAADARRKSVDAAENERGAARRQTEDAAWAKYRRTVLEVLTAQQERQLEALLKEARSFDGLGRRPSLQLMAVTGLTNAQKTKLHELARKHARSPRQPFTTVVGGAQDRRDQQDQAEKDLLGVLSAAQRRQYLAAAPPRSNRGESN